MTWQLARAMLDIDIPDDPEPDPAQRASRSAQRVTLLALALRAGNARRAWPSVAQLAEDTCLSDRAARSALRALAANELLVLTRNSNGSLTMTITAPAPPLHAFPQAAAGSAAAGSAAADSREPAADSREPAAESADGRRRDEEETKYPALFTQRENESWGEYRERGGR